MTNIDFVNKMMNGDMTLTEILAALNAEVADLEKAKAKAKKKADIQNATYLIGRTQRQIEAITIRINAPADRY